MSQPKRLRDLGPFDCRYPLGGPKDPPRLFCAKPVRDGSAYCDEHHEACYVAYVPKSEAA